MLTQSTEVAHLQGDIPSSLRGQRNPQTGYAGIQTGEGVRVRSGKKQGQDGQRSTRDGTGLDQVFATAESPSRDMEQPHPFPSYLLGTYWAAGNRTSDYRGFKEQGFVFLPQQQHRQAITTVILVTLP